MVYSTEWEQTPKDELKRIMVINLSQSVTNVDKTRPKINLDGLFSGIYYRKGDIWKSYKILLEEIPTIEEMIQSDTIIISGSTYSVNNMHEYMKLFVANLVVALDLNKKLKVTGGCFGHQLLAQAYGARIEKRQLTRGPEIVTCKPHNLGEVSYLSELCSG